jgi:hypothetical protein
MLMAFEETGGGLSLVWWLWRDAHHVTTPTPESAAFLDP